MDVKRLLLLHVEKLIVFVVVVLCAWSVYSTATNEETITNADEAEISKIFKDCKMRRRTPVVQLPHA